MPTTSPSFSLNPSHHMPPWKENLCGIGCLILLVMFGIMYGLVILSFLSLFPIIGYGIACASGSNLIGALFAIFLFALCIDWSPRRR